MHQRILLVVVGVCLGVVVSALSVAVAAGTGNAPSRPALINHVVYFKLHDTGQSGQLIADCDAMAAAIPGIVSSFCGAHLDTGRDTVDGDYDVGFYVGFNTPGAYSAYVAHEAHVALVTKWRPRLQWLRVHDIVDKTD